MTKIEKSKKSELKSVILKHVTLKFTSNLLSPDDDGDNASGRYQVVVGLTEEQAEMLTNEYGANLRYYTDSKTGEEMAQLTARTNAANIAKVKIVSANPKIPFDLEGNELPWGTLINLKVLFADNPRRKKGPKQNLLQAVQVLQLPEFNGGGEGFEVEEDYDVDDDGFSSEDFDDEAV